MKAGARGYRWRNFHEDRPDDPLYPKAADYVASISTRHGADGTRRVAPIAEALEAAVVVWAPWVARDAFAPAVRAWAWAEARCELYRAWFGERGLFGEDGEPLPGLERWDRAEVRAQGLRVQLGLDPQSLAKLLGSLTAVAVAGGDDDGLAALKAEGAEIIAAREGLVTGDGTDDE